MKIYLTIHDNYTWVAKRYIRFHKKKHPGAYISTARDFLFIIRMYDQKDYVYPKRDSLLNLRRMSRFD